MVGKKILPKVNSTRKLFGKASRVASQDFPESLQTIR
jgi:hypothetical protein